MNNVHFKSVKMDWGTPDSLFNQLDLEYNFQRDLAASDINAKCLTYFTELDNSLNIDWHKLSGWSWLNPPYGRQLKHWIKKCHEEAELGAKIVCLLPARTDTSYFHDYIYGKYEITFLRGRVKFLNNGEEMDAAPFPSMIVVFKKKISL